MQFMSRLYNALLLCCLIGTTPTAMASSVPFAVESDGSYSYYLAGNSLFLSNSDNISIGGHNANNPGINLINYQSGQIQVGGFLDLNNVSLGSYESGYGDVLSVFTTSNNSSLSISTLGTLTINTTINGFNNVTLNAGSNVTLNAGAISLNGASFPLPPGGSGSGTLCAGRCNPSVIASRLLNPCDISGCPVIFPGGSLTIPTLNSVPLPPALALLLSGLSLLGFTSRRHKEQ